MSFVARVAAVHRHRRILGTLVRRDLKIRYGRSVLGYVWTLIDPLAMAGVYYLVFGVIFRRAEVESLPFIVFLLAGLLPWNWFNLSVTETSRALYAERLLVRSTNIPRELWVLRVVLAKGVEFLLSLPILAAFVALFVVLGDVTLNWRLVLMVPAAVVQLALLVGIGLVMAPVTALVDDVARVVRILLRMLFYLSPILYSPAALEGYDWAQGLFQLNPLTGIIELYRAGLTAAPLDGSAVALAVGVALGWLAVGGWVFARLERPVLKEI